VGRRETIVARVAPVPRFKYVTVYCVVVLIGGALLAPLLYGMAQAAGQYSSMAQSLAAQPFHRFVNRAMLALGLIGLFPLLRSLGMNSAKALGLHEPRRWVWNGVTGYALGFASLACVAALTLAVGVRKLEARPPHEFASVILSAALSAVVVAILEEVLFRGALFGAMRKDRSLPVAVLLSSGIYAIVHFFERPPSPAVVEWTSGLTTLLGMLAGFSDLGRLVPGFLTLLLAGAILAIAYQYSGTLYFSIGLHAGWIFWLKIYRATTAGNGRVVGSFWGTHKMIDGWLAVFIMGLLLVGLETWRRREMKSSHAS
jgi:uncharacterized protein